MKKLALLLSITAFVACSKDDDDNNNDTPEVAVEITAANLEGKWVYESDTHTPTINDDYPNDLMEIDCFDNNSYYQISVSADNQLTGQLHMIESNCLTSENSTHTLQFENLATSFDMKVGYGGSDEFVDEKFRAYVRKEITQLTENTLTLELRTINTHKVDEFGNPMWQDSDGDGNFEAMYEELTPPNTRVEVLTRLVE